MNPFIGKVIAALALLPGAPMPAHGGGQATSNYRNDQIRVAPAVPGLVVGYDDADSSVTLTWRGDGEVIVMGYEGEPFMRISSAGVDRNVHSPATYLNQDRYARVSLPSIADATAAPQWERLSGSTTVRWHDHRTHWMDPTPSAEVRANPDRTTVVFPEWEIPLTVDGVDATISGRLSWVPPPAQTPWVAFAIALVVVLGSIAFAARRRSEVAVLGAAIVATAMFTVDSLGYLAAAPPGGSGRVLYIVWPVVLTGAVVAAVLRTRFPGKGVISLAVVGAILAAVAGYDRLDAVNHSQVHSTLPAWFSRLSAVVCLAVGIAVLVAAVLRVLAAAPAGQPAATLEPTGEPAA